jgi:uncharacterized protein (DUF1501 family)
MKRRTFIKFSSLGAGIPLATGVLTQTAQASAQEKKTAAIKRRTVILVELRGGNDGLNTLIPFSDPLYYKLRPSIAIPRKSMLPISDSLAMHPSLGALKSYWNGKEMAWIQGVGYPHSNRSHFRSIDIWDTASNYNQIVDQGWVANLFGASHDISGVAMNADLGPLLGDRANSLRINDLNAFMRSDQHMKARSSNTSNSSLAHLLKTERIVTESNALLEKYLRKVGDLSSRFPRHKFGREFASVARLINSNVDIPVYKISLSNFDTHSSQPHQHARLLKMLGDSLHAFAQNMKQSGHWDDVLVMTYSEFGRQVMENGSRGTDHGEAAAHLVMGGKVQGGVYGRNPDLKRLHKNALRHSVDFRSVYGTVTSRWWGMKNPWNRPLIPFV